MTEGPWIAAEAGSEDRRHAPATLRNRDAILAVLRQVLPAQGLVLEIASGSGEHAAWFAGQLRRLVWQPSDPDEAALRSIVSWSAEVGHINLRPPVRIDAAAADWPIEAADAILCINMVHISPWAATRGLFAGAARLLPEGAPLYIYGPFVQAGVPTAPSNLTFDESLKARDPGWGLRAVEDVSELAARHGFAKDRIVPMPANNLSLVYRR
ncbi:hypothetical protein FHS96_001737 [Sphingomonas zeicaulis]|uniref:DUF938 domain-containing protein n=1 Tax=Sphingomonas zeicaulis TaxID=1632740 RepID=UPI003D1D48B2